MQLSCSCDPALRRLAMWALTYRCTLRCTYCYLATPHDNVALTEREAAPDIVWAIARSLASPHNWRPDAVWLTGGEPTLHSQLFSLIEMFETAGVMTIVTTAGVLNEPTTRSLMEARPRGIMVSLDVASPADNDVLRGGGDRVLRTIEDIARRKDPYTTLGVSVVVTNANVRRLDELCHALHSRGVDYLSLNPLYDYCSSTRALAPRGPVAEAVEHSVAVASSLGLQLPSQRYLRILTAHLAGARPEFAACPAAHEYAFIAPWGAVYPCSAEFWHSHETMLNARSAANGDFRWLLVDLQRRLGGATFSTQSNCFSARCVGCWKLYYDSVFTRHLTI